MSTWIAETLEDAYAIISTMVIQDIVDILMVALAVYGLIVVVRDTNTSQVVKGILLLFAANVFAEEIGLRTFGYFLQTVLDFGIIALIVLFQPEIRRGLDQMGRARFLGNNLFVRRRMQDKTKEDWQKAISSICDAVQQLADKSTGALIVVERTSNLYDYSRNATKIDADISTELLCNIFYNGSPLHDGAIIISDARLLSAGCVMPLSGNLELSKDLGTRHRAALGVAELTDAISIVVSEETGTVSIAKNGVLIRRINRSSLYSMLLEDIIPSNSDDGTKKRKKGVLGRLFATPKKQVDEKGGAEDEK